MPIDCCAIALQLGCSFVARSFSGDVKQLRALLKAAYAHRGTAVLDVISPCVTFADHEGSTKSYAYVKEHDAPLHSIDFVPHFEDIHVDYEPGSKHLLKKLGADYDPASREGAIHALEAARREQKLLTGLLYVEPEQMPFEE